MAASNCTLSSSILRNNAAQVLTVQPLLALATIFASMLMNSTPIDRGFGLISILAGIERNSLRILEGASLSGKLRGDARLRIDSIKPGDSVEYNKQL